MIRLLRIILATIGALFCVAILIALAVNALPLFIVLSPFFLCIIAALILSATGSSIRRRSMLVLSYVEQAVRLNLPLPQMLMAAAASEPPSTARLLNKLRHNLESGMSIPQALHLTCPAIGPRILGLIDSAQRFGQLPQTLQRIMKESPDRRLNDPVDSSFLHTYPPILAATIFVIITMVMIFVMPKFQQIFYDFHTDLPGVTKLLIAISAWFSQDYGWIVVLLVLIFGIFCVQQFASGSSRFTRSRDWADVCRVLAGGLDAGLPLDESLRQAEELSVAPSVRRKLHRWADAAQQGQSPPDAARAAGMPPLISGMTTTGLAATNMAEVFHFLGRYYAGKFSRLTILLRGAAIPAITLLFGAVVAFVALGLFAPLISLISSVSGYRGAL